jgi:hypothetical protein
MAHVKWSCVLASKSWNPTLAEPLRERVVGRRVEVYFSGMENTWWLSVESYDADADYYLVRLPHCQEF